MVEKLFEFFDAEKTKLTVKKDVGEGAAKGNVKCATECEIALDDFAESDRNSTGIWYHGEVDKISDVVSALRKFAAEKGYHVWAEVAETTEGKEAILFRKLNEAEFKKTQEEH